MGRKMKPDQLSGEILDILDEYQETVTDRVKKAVLDTASDTVKELKKTSPKRTGKYAKSWTKKVVKDTSQEEYVTIYARRYQLTHLLENGHAKRGGGRTKAVSHIRPAEQKAVKKLEEEITKGVQDG